MPKEVESEPVLPLEPAESLKSITKIEQPYSSTPSAGSSPEAVSVVENTAATRTEDTGEKEEQGTIEQVNPSDSRATESSEPSFMSKRRSSKKHRGNKDGAKDKNEDKNIVDKKVPSAEEPIVFVPVDPNEVDKKILVLPETLHSIMKDVEQDKVVETELALSSKPDENDADTYAFVEDTHFMEDEDTPKWSSKLRDNKITIKGLISKTKGGIKEVLAKKSSELEEKKRESRMKKEMKEEKEKEMKEQERKEREIQKEKERERQQEREKTLPKEIVWVPHNMKILLLQMLDIVDTFRAQLKEIESHDIEYPTLFLNEMKGRLDKAMELVVAISEGLTTLVKESVRG